VGCSNPGFTTFADYPGRYDLGIQNLIVVVVLEQQSNKKDFLLILLLLSKFLVLGFKSYFSHLHRRSRALIIF